MRRLLPPIAAAIALGLSSPASAQEMDEQLWTTTTVETDVGKGFTGSGHLVVRFAEDAGGVSQVQAGADVEYALSDKVRIGTGYSYIPSYDDGDLTSREHRTRQQVSVKLGRALGGDVATRLRLEQRWRDDGDDVALRLRPRLTWTRGIAPDGLALRLLHESFLNLNDSDWGGDARYDRMRNQVSLTRRLGSSLSGEVGYLNQYRFRHAAPDAMDHALTLALTLRL